MLNLQRLVVVGIGTGLVVMACAAPTESSSTSPVERDDGIETESAAADDENESAIEDESEDMESADSSAMTPGDADRLAADLGNVEGGEYAAGYHHHPCNRHDAFHCRRGHRGWHWVVRSHSHGGPSGGWLHGRRCCVRIERPHHPHF